MINWFDMPAEGLSNGGLFEIKELTATENKVYQKDGEVYNKVTVNVPSPTGKITITENGTDIDIAQYALADVNVEGGGGSSDLPQGANLSYYHLIINCAPTEYDGNLTFASVGDPTSLYCPVENGQIMTELEISYSGGIQNKEIDILALTLSENAYSYLQYISIPDGFSVSATGGVTAGQDSDGWYLDITGSGTITIS